MILFINASPSGYFWPSFVSIFSQSTAFQHEGCNTVSYGTTPDLGTWMIGRVMNSDPFDKTCNFVNQTNPAPNLNWSLTMVQMDWSTNTVRFDHKILDTTNFVKIESGSHSIVSAYDATIVPFQGEYWVAFECALAYSGPGSGGVGSCVGPLLPNKSLNQVMIDANRISVVVNGSCPVSSNT